MEKLCRNSNGVKIIREWKRGKDEGAFETKFTVFYKNDSIALQIKLRQKGGGGGGQCLGASPPGYTTGHDCNTQVGSKNFEKNILFSIDGAKL